MRKPRIIFFDIDGTLIDMEKKQVTPLMLDTLHRLQANGIRLAIATGRSPMTVPLWDFPGVQFDVLVTFNGAYCYDKNRVLFASPIPAEDVRTLRRSPGPPPVRGHREHPCRQRQRAGSGRLFCRGQDPRAGNA